MNCPNCKKAIEGFIISESIWTERWCSMEGIAEEYEIVCNDPDGCFIYCPRCSYGIFDCIEDLEKFLGTEIIFN